MYRCGETVPLAAVSHNAGWTSRFYCRNTNKQTCTTRNSTAQTQLLEQSTNTVQSPNFPPTNFKITWTQSNLCQQKMSRTTACTHLAHGKLWLGGCPLTKKHTTKLLCRFPGVLISTQLHFHTRGGRKANWLSVAYTATNGVSCNVSINCTFLAQIIHRGL